MSALEEFLRGLQQEAASRPVDRDGDWTSTFAIESFQGQTVLLVVDPACYESVETKNQLAETLGQSVISMRGVRVGGTQHVWAVQRDHGDDDPTLPAEDPNRVELLTVWAVDLDELVYSFAPVHREPGAPPSLGDWQIAEGGEVDGRFLTAVRLALHWVRGMAEDPLALLREVAGRLDEGDPKRDEIEEVLRVGESDPELVESMPIRQWWRARAGER